MSVSPTYVYDNPSRNFIIDTDLVSHVKKVERWRLGNERSEDALSWNVFVSLARLGELRHVLRQLTRLEVTGEPILYLWGNRVDHDRPVEWEELKSVRKALNESNANFPTEPDEILQVPGEVIVLVEAKFGSPNGTLAGKEDRFSSVDDFLYRYPPPEGRPDSLNRKWIERQQPDQVLEQLCRNVVFAQWLAEKEEKAFVVNLVRQVNEIKIEERFSAHLVANSPVGFRRSTWEEIYALPVITSRDAEPLRSYFLNKTANWEKAFALSPRESK